MTSISMYIRDDDAAHSRYDYCCRRRVGSVLNGSSRLKPSSPAVDQPPPLLAPPTGQWAAARRVPLCPNPQSASDVEVVELRAWPSPSVCVTASTCRRRADAVANQSQPCSSKMRCWAETASVTGSGSRKVIFVLVQVGWGKVAVLASGWSDPLLLLSVPSMSMLVFPHGSRFLHSLLLPSRGIPSFSHPSFASAFTPSNICISNPST